MCVWSCLHKLGTLLPPLTLSGLITRPPHYSHHKALRRNYDTRTHPRKHKQKKDCVRKGDWFICRRTRWWCCELQPNNIHTCGHSLMLLTKRQNEKTSGKKHHCFLRPLPQSLLRLPPSSPPLTLREWVEKQIPRPDRGWSNKMCARV